MKYLMFAACYLAPAITLAADGDTEMAWWAQALVGLSGMAGTALLGLAGKALSKLFNYLAAKSNLALLANVDEVLMGYVTRLYNAEIKHLKAAAADGKLTANEKRRFLRIAIEEAKAHFGYGTLAKLFGGEVEERLGARVEKAVTIAKNAGRVAKAVAANP